MRNNKTDQRAHYSRLRDAGKLTGTIKRAMALWAARQANVAAEPPTLLQRHQARRVAVAVTGGQAVGVVSVARGWYPRRQNWDSVAATTEPITNARGVTVADIDHGKYSGRCTYTYYTYEPRVESWAILLGSTLRYHYRGQCYQIRTPHGYRWDVDSLGLRLVSLAHPADDYHVGSGDLLTDDDKPQALRTITSRLRYNADCRRDDAKREADEKRRTRADEKRARIAIRLAEKAGCRVSVADSISVGNCEAGTIRWATQHGLDPQRAYKPSELIKIANGDGHRVARVVRQAIRRHKRNAVEV